MNASRSLRRTAAPPPPDAEAASTGDAPPVAGTAGRARADLVRELDLVSHERTQVLDDLVALAAQLCAAPLGGISVVGGDREWLVAERGIGRRGHDDVRPTTWRTLAAGTSYVVDGSRPDPRLTGSVLGAGGAAIATYAGVPLRLAGVPIGALFVADPVSRAIDDTHEAALVGLARQVEHVLDMRRAMRASARGHDELRGAQLRLQRILDAITQGVVVHAPDGSIVQSNPAAQRILGFTEDQLRGRSSLDPHWQTISRDGSPFPGEQHPAAVTLREGVAVHDVTFGVTRPDGERRWLLVNSSPLPTTDSDEVGAVATFSDITEITELNDQLHESLRELAEAAQERAALLSAVSHDIRAPLASIRMMTEILEDRADAITHDQRSELIHRVRVEARRTEGVLADLVSANRVGTGLLTPRRQRVDVDQLVRTVAREFANDDHEVRVGALDGDLMLSADRAQLERILDNLISNAVRHTPAGSHVVVSAVETPDAVELAVSDDGPGVSDAMKGRIFDAYVRGERSENRPGSGLGLYLVQQFAQFHGGRAWCEDAPEGGARFVVSLPRRVGDAPEAATATHPSTA